MRDLTFWIEPDTKAYSAEYWNDAAEEEGKAWAIRSPDDASLRTYLESLGAFDDFEQVWRAVGSRTHLKVLDVAAGTCWASALFSAKNAVDDVTAVDFSRHRLETFAPVTIEALGGNAEKIERCLGSFYDIKKPDDYFDIVFMGSAFHHADDPARLLAETNRVLKPDGLFLLVGEDRIGLYLYLRRFIKNLLVHRRLDFDFSALFPPAEETGDHYYSRAHYKKLFGAIGREAVLEPSATGKLWTIVAHKAGAPK